MTDVPERICVLARLWEPGLGDFMQRNIMLRLLRRAYPRAEVVHIVNETAARRFAEFFTHHSYASRLLTCPDDNDDREEPWVELLDRVRAERFDACLVDPDSRGFGARQARECGIPTRIGFAMGREDDADLTMPVRLPRPIFGLPDLYDYARGLAGALGLEPPAAADVVPPLPHTREQVPSLPGPVVGVHPGGAPHWNRRWPLQRFGEVCQRLARTHDASFVLFGSADDRLELDTLAAQIAGARMEISCGERLNRLANWMSNVDVLIGGDSAPAHLAASVNTATVVLYGPTMTEFMWTRIYLRHHGINRRYDCQTVRNLPRGPGTVTMPCRHSCRYPYLGPDGPYPRCLMDISVDEVYDAVCRSLTAYAAGQPARIR
jgi:heptosyltransferase-2/glycosyl transferase protein BlmE